MWLPRVLVTYLIFVKPSTAELGLPIAFLGPKDKIHSLIDNARADIESLEKTLQDLDTVPFSHGSEFVNVRRSWQDAIVKLSWIQNYTLSNLTKATDDQTSGFRKVMDGLYGSIKDSKQQLVANRGLIEPFDEWQGGPSNIQMLKGTRTELGDGLDGLWDALKTLDEVISKAQRETPLTESTIGKVVTADMTLAVWSAVAKIQGSIKPLEILVNGLLAGANFARQDANQTNNELNKMMDLKGAEFVGNATVDATTKIQIITATLTQNVNQTVWTAYKPLVKSIKQFQGANTIDSFLTNFSRNIMNLNNSVMNNAQWVYTYLVKPQPSLQTSVVSRGVVAADLLGLQVFANTNSSSLTENCLQKCSLVNVTLGKVFKLFNSCALNQLRYISTITATIDEFLQSIRAAAMAPLADLQTCTASKLDRNLCLKTFSTTFMFESSGSTSNRNLIASINRMTKQTLKVVENEFSDVYNRFTHCAKENVALSSMDELLKKRDNCIGIPKQHILEKVEQFLIYSKLQ